MSDEAVPMQPDAQQAPDEASEESERRGGCLTALIPVTTPGCASLLTSVFLITTVLTVWFVFWLDPANVPWRHAYAWWRILAVVGLCCLIPWVVHRTISLWLEGATRAFPELSAAWQAGLNALSANAIAIDSVPVFLITGSASETQEKAFMNASGLRFSVEGVPQGPAPIHWYANSEAIYLFCSDASWSSALASLREELLQEAAAKQQVGAEPGWLAPIGSDQAAAAPAAAATVAPAAPHIRGTVELTDYMGQSTAAPLGRTPSATPAPLPSGGSSDLRGTLMFGNPATPAAAASNPPPQPMFRPAPPPVAPPLYVTSGGPGGPLEAATANLAPILVSHQYSSACLQELHQLGLLLRRARQPLCPINGVLNLIPLEAIHSSPAELEELQKAIRGDMETIRHAAQIRVPVSAIIVGLEKERGFRELVLRVGKERAMSQRFGRRFDVQAIPTKEQLGHLALHVCGVFEDWAYALFREEQALTRPGNTRLYELLSKVRCGWKGRLGEILAGGFGCEPSPRQNEHSLFFSGCYCAATGETLDRQAFVKGIIDKLGEEQELIEWTPQARRSNQWQNVSANLGMIVTLILAVLLLALFLWPAP